MRQRVITALLLAIPALFALASREMAWLFLLGLLAAWIGGLEAERLLAVPRPSIAALAALIFGYTASPLLSRDTQGSFSVAILMAAATLFGAVGAALPDRFPLRSFFRSLALLWIVAPLISILMLHRMAAGGTWVLSPALMALVPVWAGDIAAIFVGKAFGKHPLAPKISPKKTVEGSLGNLVAAILAAWLLGRLLGLPDARSLAAGLAVGIFGQVGDLFESWLKRRADVKDSGTLLPGHGGVLDRIDSVLFAAPVVAVLLLR